MPAAAHDNNQAPLRMRLVFEIGVIGARAIVVGTLTDAMPRSQKMKSYGIDR